MAKVHEAITEQLQAFIARQHLFFVASAPLDASGHVNVSPKGTDCFRVLSPTRVCYLDWVGSGNETSAHLLENGRITFMFCAFEGAPSVLRLYGLGRTVLPGQPGWDELARLFTLPLGARQFIAADISRVQTSCGFGVPLYDYAGERDQMLRWAEAKGAEGLAQYQQKNNRASIDGLPTALAADPAAP